MKKVCTFCGKVIDAGASPDDPVSHGVCPACYRQLLARYGFDLTKFLDFLEAPVFLVDSDVNVLAANSRALSYVGKTKDRIQGKLCGDVLECINAFRPKGCGKTDLCPDCTFRSSVIETYSTGNPVTRRSAVLLTKNGDLLKEIPFLVSTRKDGDVVLLRLEPVAAAV
ncbi:MAG: hypothetical protein ABFC24_11345 [Methanoregulaceae archaeon]